MASGVEQRTLDMALQRFTRRAAEAAQGRVVAMSKLLMSAASAADASAQTAPAARALLIVLTPHCFLAKLLRSQPAPLAPQVHRPECRGDAHWKITEAALVHEPTEKFPLARCRPTA
jgi:hypothetical protein